MAVAISNDFLSPLEIISCLSSSNGAKEAHKNLTTYLGGAELHFTSSGSDALLRIFQALKTISSKPLIAIAAYSCPHIAIAAGIAGFKVLPLDTEINSFDPKLSEADLLQQCAAIVLSNLYGLPNDLDKWQAAVSPDTLIIDDACQAFLSKRNGHFVGTSHNTIGAISFGRGKPLAGVGGGAIVASPDNSDLVTSVYAAATKQQFHANNNPTEGFKAFAYWLATRRLVFELLLRSPMDIGKPDCPETIRQAAATPFEFTYLAAQSRKLSLITKALKANATAWSDALSELPFQQPLVECAKEMQNDLVAIRYPLICNSSQQCQQALAILRQHGIGATAGYRKVIQDWPLVAPYVAQHPDTTNARAMSDRVILLPNHSQLKLSDIAVAATALSTRST